MTGGTSPSLIVADIGGTNTRVALSEGRSLRTESIRRYRNDHFSGLDAVLSEFVSEMKPSTLDGACVAVAGPVSEGTAELTNRDWTIDAMTVSGPTGANTVLVLNDLEAQGHAVDLLDANGMMVLSEGIPHSASGDALVIGVGTGFNCASVRGERQARDVSAAEAGHMTCPARNTSEFELLQFVENADDFPSVEEVLSGRGLERIYQWLGLKAGTESRANAAEIVAACEAQSEARAIETVRYFTRFLGTVTGDLALVHLPRGGIFLVGGVAQSISPYFTRFGFLEAMTDKGRFSGLVGSYPVTVVTDDYAALLGCSAAMATLV